MTWCPLSWLMYNYHLLAYFRRILVTSHTPMFDSGWITIQIPNFNLIRLFPWLILNYSNKNLVELIVICPFTHMVSIEDRAIGCLVSSLSSWGNYFIPWCDKTKGVQELHSTKRSTALCLLQLNVLFVSTNHQALDLFANEFFTRFSCCRKGISHKGVFFRARS